MTARAAVKNEEFSAHVSTINWFRPARAIWHHQRGVQGQNRISILYLPPTGTNQPATPPSTSAPPHHPPNRPHHPAVKRKVPQNRKTEAMQGSKKKNGHLDLPVVSDTAPLDPIREELGLGKKEKISSSSILDRIKMGGTDDFTMHCILMILFSKLLAPDSSTDITGNIVNMVSKNLELYKDMALCKFVVDHLRWSAERWKSGKRSTVYGCTTLLVVYYLDNLLCKAMISNTDTPRSQFFNSSLIDKIENLTILSL
uniref:Uncharacterized protein n=1 Tax=Oryza punctata TaxID=4537 RepID=A0A0E0M8X8_ORYPU